MKLKMRSLSFNSKNYTLPSWSRSESQRTSSIPPQSRNRHCHSFIMANKSTNWLWLALLAMLLCLMQHADCVIADESAAAAKHHSTTPLTPDFTTAPALVASATTSPREDWQPIVNGSSGGAIPNGKRVNGNDSIFLRFARSFSSGNELWDGIIRDCYNRPDMSCFQKNVYSYLDGALNMQDVNVTQRLRFFKNEVQYEPEAEAEAEAESEVENKVNEARSASPETPIEEVSNAFYGKTIKFAMTHDVEVKLPEIIFNGATFRISPRSIEGNGVIAKLELIPKQSVAPRLLGMIKKKIDKFLRNKLLLSFIALLLIIKIIKIKLFWLLPIVIGVGAAKKLLLKFLLFLFPALSHLFKLCSYYQQSYHHQGTKYHHHHHLINHHHTVVPPWHSGEHHSVPEIIYTHPPKGHPSAYLHGAPVHESYGPGPGHEHFEGAWENSGPGLGSEYIGDINRAAHVEDNAHFFKPHTSNDENELHSWGLGTTQTYTKQQYQQQQQQQQQQQTWPVTQQQRPPTHPQQHQQQHQQHQQQQFGYQKPHASSHSLNKLQGLDKQSSRPAYSQQNPVYVSGPGRQNPPPGQLTAAQIAAQYEPARNNLPQQQHQQQQQHQHLQQHQQQLSPELSAQLKEAIRIQAEQRLIQQQQQILENQPFVQDGQPLYPLNYDPFYSPILLKIDKIIEQLGVKNDLCKERIVCNMYKDPSTYSPHSNFISAELSRLQSWAAKWNEEPVALKVALCRHRPRDLKDTNELEPVTHANEAVRRFYRLIQAARDGQDQKDCVSLYPQCKMQTK